MKSETETRTNSRSKSNKLIQSRFLRIYCYILVGSLMSYIRSIYATAVDKLKLQMWQETIRHTHTRIRLQLRAGICIIRLITLKRFLKILAMPTNNHQMKLEWKQEKLEKQQQHSEKSQQLELTEKKRQHHKEKEQESQEKQQLKEPEKEREWEKNEQKLQLEKEETEKQNTANK